MSDKELIARYRNLLIVLAKTQLRLMKESQLMRSRIEETDSPGKRAGLACLSRCLAKQANILATTLRRNNSALKFMFHTTKLEEVSVEEIKLSSE